ncbi:MAG: GNAT family N-acetyltransferase [Candidatus Thorarchaeota archaeon]
MEITIRPAAVDDCEVCARLSRIQELDSADADYIPANFFEANIDDDEMFLVAELKGNVVGYVLGQPMKGDIASLTLLTVEESMRGQGIGKALVDVFLKRCKKKNLTYVHLFGPSFNEVTLAFYRSMGFEQGKEYTEFGIQI